MERVRRVQLPKEITNFTPLGAMLRDARISQGRSARKVAKEAGMSAVYLLALEDGKNPKTGKPSIPSPALKSRLFSVLGITTGIADDTSADTPSDTSKIPNLSSLSVREVGIMSAHEREKAANMVRDGRFDVDVPNNEFNYYIALANLYDSAAVVMQAFISQLDKDIQELKDKYKIGEIDVNSQGSETDIVDIQDDALTSKDRQEQ